MSKIIRTPTRAEGGLTQDEQARMAEHVRLWTGRAFRTDPIQPEKIVPAIHGLYAAANLKQPRVVIVPSPLVMALAGGFASAIWYARKTGSHAATYAATDAATYDATRAATDDATRDATYAATRAATDAATRAATDAATYAATRAATDDATYAATDDATRDATYAATDDATRDATYDATHDANWAARLAREVGGPELAPLMLSCARSWWRPYQGGNMWASWVAFLSAFRDVLGLQLPEFEKFAPFEQASIEGGFRWMHDEFCMVCDFPEVLEVDDQNRPHNASGPSHRWRDGWSLYHWHGVRIAEYIIERPHEITVALIDREPNAEVRRVMIERYGQDKYLLDSGAALQQRDAAGLLYRKELPGDEPIVMVRVLNSTPEPDGVMSRDEAIATFGDAAKAATSAPESARFKEYMLRVPPTIHTAREAVAWTFGMEAEAYDPVFES